MAKNVLNEHGLRYCSGRLRVWRCAHGDDCPTAWALRHLAGTRPASALCHRRIFHAAGEPAARRAGLPLRIAAAAAPGQLGKLAENISANRLWIEAPAHLVPSSLR